ncbi:hypothetical protein JXA85_00905 [Candidatus Woesearchaeota archaeon]|nr:hypothetical protein [Candidatus Woesearchaeota archaeon]
MMRLPRIDQNELEKLSFEKRKEIDRLTKDKVKREYVSGSSSKLSVVITYEALDKAEYLAKRTSELAEEDIETCFYTLDDFELMKRNGAVTRDIHIPKRMEVTESTCKIIDKTIDSLLSRLGYAHSHGRYSTRFISGEDLDRQVFREIIAAFGGPRIDVEIPTEIEEQRYQPIIYSPTFVVNSNGTKARGYMIVAFRRKTDNQLDITITPENDFVPVQMVEETHPLFKFDKKIIDERILKNTYVEKNGIWVPLEDKVKRTFVAMHEQKEGYSEKLSDSVTRELLAEIKHTYGSLESFLKATLKAYLIQIPELKEVRRRFSNLRLAYSNYEKSISSIELDNKIVSFREIKQIGTVIGNLESYADMAIRTKAHTGNFEGQTVLERKYVKHMNVLADKLLKRISNDWGLYEDVINWAKKNLANFHWKRNCCLNEIIRNCYAIMNSGETYSRIGKNYEPVKRPNPASVRY